MLKKELADALGISGPMVSKLAKRGMPTDSVERAQRWRKRHLEPGRLKSSKAKGGTPKSPAPAPPSRAGGPVEVRPAPRPPTQPSPDDEDEFSSELDGDLLFQKTRETKARADKLEMELVELQSALTRADECRKAAYEAARELRHVLKDVGRNAAPKVLQAATLFDKQAVIEREVRHAQNVFTENLRRAIEKYDNQTPAPAAQASPGTEGEFSGTPDADLLFQKTRETKARADKLEMELVELQSALTRADECRKAAYEAARELRHVLKDVGRNAAPKVLQAATLFDKQAVIEREVRHAQNVFTENLRRAIEKYDNQTPAPAAQASPGTEGEFSGTPDADLLFQKTRETKARADKLELELAEAQGILIRVAEVRMGAFTCTRTVRDLLTCVGRNAAHKVMQATSLADCQTVIDLEIGAILDYQENRLLPDLFQRIAPKLPPAGDTAPT